MGLVLGYRADVESKQLGTTRKPARYQNTNKSKKTRAPQGHVGFVRGGG